MYPILLCSALLFLSVFIAGLCRYHRSCPPTRPGSLSVQPWLMLCLSLFFTLLILAAAARKETRQRSRPEPFPAVETVPVDERRPALPGNGQSVGN